MYCRLYYLIGSAMPPRFRSQASESGETMPETLLEDASSQRAPIGFLVSYLKTCPEHNVKELIGRRIATGVFRGDSDEVIYWAAVHHAYLGNALDKDLHLEVLGSLSQPPGFGH
jgi:hypothetical protein